MAEVTTQSTRDLEKSRGEDRRSDKKEDMTPVPTQADLDRYMGGKDVKVERPKEPEKVPPFPTQAENDEMKAKAYGTTLEALKKADEDEKQARGADTKDVDQAPTPTQDELDAHKKATMYEPEDNPGGGTDPQKAPAAKQKQIEAKKPAETGGYQTRTVEHHNTKSE
jgi:hypothetical protein